jgi:hypothetical protein
MPFYRLKNERSLEWRSHEEARRVAVETTLAELLARDTQYRKELKTHVEGRLQEAELKKLLFREKSREVRIP